MSGPRGETAAGYPTFMRQSLIPRTMLCLLILLCLPATALMAGGQSEQDQIDQARTMMAEQNYKGALKVLIKIREKNPDLRELTQSFFDECFFHVEQVTKLEKDILAAIDAFDEEKTLSFMEKLKTLDKGEFDIFFKISYQRRLYVKNRNEFYEYMDQAYAQVQASRWREAIDAYKKAAGVYRAAFFENKDLGNIVPGNVQALLIELDTLLVQYFSRADTAEKGARDFLSGIAGGRVTERLDAAPALNKDLLALLAVRQRMLTVGTRLRAQNAALEKTLHNGFGHYFLIFAGQAVLGRPERPEREGFAYVVERHWDTLMGKLLKTVREQSELYFSRARQQETGGNADAAVSAYEIAGRFAGWGVSFLGQYVKLKASGTSFRLDQEDREHLKEHLPLYYFLAERRLEARLSVNLVSGRKLYETVTQRPLGNEVALRKTQEEVRGIIGSLQGNISLLEGRRRLFTELGAHGVDVAPASATLEDLLDRLSALLTAYQSLDTGFTVKFVERDYIPLRDELADKRKKFEHAKGLRTGTLTDKPAEPKGKHPTRAVTEYKALQQELRVVENHIADFLAQWSVNREYLQKNEKIREYVTAVKDAEEQMKQLRGSILEEIEAATRQKSLAEALYREARNDYAAAANAFKQKQFQETLTYLERSRGKANNSLANEEDPNVRRFLENDIARLERDTNNASQGKRFDDAINDRTTAISLYNTQNFNESLRTMENAKKTLQELPREADVADAIENMNAWIEVIKKALTIQPKRDLTGKEPNYEVTRKQLNNAAEEYKAALAAQRRNKTAEAGEHFQKARALLTQINEQYPYLKESGELSLRILKAENENLYRKELQRRIDDAVRNTDLRRSLAELEDLASLDPNYPGLRRLIAGIRKKLFSPPEVDEASRRKSQEAVAQARRYLLNPTRLNLETARKFIIDAIRLDKYNQEAGTILLEIQREYSQKK